MATSRSSDDAESVLESLMATSSDALISSTVEGLITSWNLAAEHLYGYSADEAIGLPIALLLPPEQEQEWATLLERLKRGERIERSETRRRRKDGAIIELSLMVCPLKNRTGRVVGVLSLAHDISRSKDLERHRAERFKRFMETPLVGIIVADRQSVLEANDAFLSMIGSSREAFAQGALHEGAIPPLEDGLLNQQALEELRTKGVCTPFEQEYRRTDGMHVPLFLGATLLQEDPFQYVSFVLDLTAQKAQEQRKSDLVTLTSHELRTPLTSIKGYIEVLLNTLEAPLIPTQRTYLEIIQRNVVRLAALVNDLLDLSHLESGTLELQRHVLDLNGLLQELEQNFQPQLEAKRQQLSIHLLPSPPVVLGDASRMSQILTNLLFNAHKFTPEGGSISLSLQQQGPEEVAIVVQDSGIGMTSVELSHLFTKFYRAHPLVKETEGAGMGLVITRALVEMQGGCIRVESRPAEGSTFRVSLPIVRETPMSGKEGSESGSKRILVVEDEPDHSQLVRYFLEQQGHEVLSTYRGENVVALATQAHPDLIVLDVALPTSNGLSVLAHLKGQEATASIPVLLLTVTESREEGILQGAIDTLTKPFTQVQLQQRITTLTEEAQQPLALVATQDPIARATLLEEMRCAGYRVLEANAHTLLHLVTSQRPQLVLLDGEVLLIEVRTLFDQLIAQLATLESALVVLGPWPAALQQQRDDLQREGGVRLIDKPTSVEKAGVPNHSTPPLQRDIEGIQVLIVDDDPEVVALMPLLLPEYIFLQAVSGQEALQRMREDHPDVVLLDWMMPEMDGMEVLQNMKADATLAHVPVIMLSAKYQETEIQAGFQAGAAGYLVKPFNTPDVRQAIGELATRGRKRL